MKPTCGPLFEQLFDRDNPLPFYAGFIAGQAEKVYLGACRAALIHPHGATAQYWERVLAIVQRTVGVYGLSYTAVHDEIWMHRKGDECAMPLFYLPLNSPEYHRHRAMLCGVPADEIDERFHERFTDERAK